MSEPATNTSVSLPTLDLRQRMRARQLEIVVAFDAFCQRHGLEYWLEGGTLLGAIRHKGFIPWDDDIDVSMPLGDYDRMARLAAANGGEIADGMVFQCMRTERTYTKLFGRVRDRHSTVVDQYYCPSHPTHSGLFIDILPVVPAPRPKGTRTTRLFKKIYEQEAIRHAMVRVDAGALWDIAKAMVKSAAYRAAWRLLSVGSRHLSWRPGIPASMYSFPETDVYPLATAEFEGHLLSVPGDHHTYLTRMFGPTYMTPYDDGRRHTLCVYPLISVKDAAKSLGSLDCDGPGRVFCTAGDIVSRVMADGHRTVAVYGSNEIGVEFAKACLIHGIKVLAFIDSNAALHGTKVMRIPIVSPAEALERGARAFIAGSFGSGDIMEARIRAVWSGPPEDLIVYKQSDPPRQPLAEGAL